jgi:NADPH:quinone reductase-like Zn-dependent oxidoreductase
VKAIRVHACGGPEAMVLEDVPLPSPGPGQVVVEVKAAGVNLFDTQLRSGLYKRDLPLTLGLEGAGIVAAVGPEVTDIASATASPSSSPPAPTPRTPWRRPSASCHCQTASASKTPRR